MSLRLWPVLTDAPSTVRWDYGDCPYALEPLTLPPAGAWHGVATESGPSLRGMSLVDDFGVPADLGPAPADELFWFRWITGHQVSFILWRLIGQVIHETTTDALEPVAAMAALRAYVRGYCGMLLYTGSCPRGLYEALIRPSMRLRHPAFSGAWAPDFWPIRDLLRGRRSALAQVPGFPDVPGADAVTEAVKLHQLVHEVVASRLVEDGKSLLRRSTVRWRDTAVLHLLYDNYFVTVRAPVGPDDVNAQLLRRLVAIARDLRVNGLYPWAVDEPPGDAHVTACEVGLVDILDAVASSAVRAGLMADAQPA